MGQHENFPIESLTIDRNRELVASCSHDQTIKFWNVKLMHNLKVSDEHKAKKKDGQQLLPSSRNEGFFSDFAL